jgi:hypothetical protein
MVSFSRLRGSLVIADCGLDDTSFPIDCLLTLAFSQSEQPSKPPAFIASRSLRPTRVTQRSFSAPLSAYAFMLLGSGCVSLEPCPDYLVDCDVGSCARRAGLHVGERAHAGTCRLDDHPTRRAFVAAQASADLLPYAGSSFASS